jgi:hypothetical protein
MQDRLSIKGLNYELRLTLWRFRVTYHLCNQLRISLMFNPRTIFHLWMLYVCAFPCCSFYCLEARTEPDLSPSELGICGTTGAHTFKQILGTEGEHIVGVRAGARE